MKKISLPIDASKYDVRVTWAGLKEDEVPADAGVIDGFPIDPPDERAGWLLVGFGVQAAKDADRYWSLWARAKSKAKKRRQAALQSPPKKRGGGRKKKPSQETTGPTEPPQATDDAN